MKRAAACLLLLIAGCARPSGTDTDRNELYNAGVASLHPSAQPVTIGYNGPQAPACAARGRVVNLSAGGETTLAVRSAPFADADQTGALVDDAPLFLCSRSIDQRWQGVIVPPPEDAAADCGVAAPIAAARPYAGPCRSGWVLASFVQVADR